MNNVNKKLKFGRGGKRNRQRRNRMMRRPDTAKKLQRMNVKVTKLMREDFLGLPVVMLKEIFIETETIGLNFNPTPQIDLSGPWNESIAKEAFALWEASCTTQKEFATAHNFPVSRFRSWKSKIAA